MFTPTPHDLSALTHRQPPTYLSRLQHSPYKTLAQTLQRPPPAPRPHPLQPRHNRTCISDTHNAFPALPTGADSSDLLIHAGDLTQSGTFEELQAQLGWLNAQPFEHKVVIAGNHENILDPKHDNPNNVTNTNSPPHNRNHKQKQRHNLNFGTLIYLCDTSTRLHFASGRTLNIYGSPHTRGPGNGAFQHRAGTDKFAHKVPDETDILVTHAPPRWHRDGPGCSGDEALLYEMLRVGPALGVCGHVHQGRGREIIHTDSFEGLHKGQGRDVLSYAAFEELYRDLCVERGGIGALVGMLLLFVVELVGLGSRGTGRAVRIVNAAVVGGGWRDELRRGAITVTI